MNNIPERSFIDSKNTNNLIREIMKKPKTLFLFINREEGGFFNTDEAFFFEKYGNYSHLDNTFINEMKDEEKEEELFNLMGGSISIEGDGVESIGFPADINALKIPTKDWDFFVMCGIV